MKRICAITMARNDDFFLEKWITYYGEQLGKENLYPFLDGLDQKTPDNAEGTNLVKCVHDYGTLSSGNSSRVAHLSKVAAELLEKYDLVIGTDVDEFLVVDPNCGKTLAEYLSELSIKSSVSGLGLDVGQKLDEEGSYNKEKTLLEQRQYAVLYPDYTKPVVIAKPLKWGVGLHRIRGHNFKIDPNLYLFHFGCFDLEMLQQRFQDKDRLAAGWASHLQNRRRTIDLVTQKKALSGERFLRKARFIQTWFRPPYKWNRPSMLNLELVVKIPERFKPCI